MYFLLFLASFQVPSEAAWMIQETGCYQPIHAQQLAVAPDGRVYILTKDPPYILHFNSEGQLVQSFAERGSGPGALDKPRYLWFYQDRLFAVDFKNIQSFSLEGEHLDMQKIPQGLFIKGRVSTGWIGQRMDLTDVQTTTHGIWDESLTSPIMTIHTNAKPIPRGGKIEAFQPRTLVTHSNDGRFIFLNPQGTTEIRIIHVESQATREVVTLEPRKIPITQDMIEKFEERLKSSRARSMGGLDRKIKLTYPEFLPDFIFLKTLATGEVVLTRRTNNEEKAEYLYFNEDGQLAEAPVWDPSILSRMLRIQGNWAYLGLWDEELEEAAIAKVALQKVASFFAKGSGDPP